MIDQTYLSVITGRGKNSGLRDERNSLHGFCVDEFQIFYGEAIWSVCEQVFFGA